MYNTLLLLLQRPAVCECINAHTQIHNECTAAANGLCNMQLHIMILYYYYYYYYYVRAKLVFATCVRLGFFSHGTACDDAATAATTTAHDR